MTLKTGLVHDDVYKDHEPRPGHPECPARYDAAMAGVQARVAPEALQSIAPRPAPIETLVLCHTPDYIETVRRDVAAGVGCLSTGDTDICPRTFDVARQAVGGALAAVDAVVTGQVANAFGVLRPPGHHATGDRGMGFCVFNNVAVAARYAQRQHGVGPVLIVDWDVHHGNGTQAIFYDDPSVFYFSTHQWPLYPGTGRADESGRGPGEGTTLNCPVASGSGRREIQGAVEQKLIPAMKTFQPELVLISAGFDARIGDPVGQCRLSDADYVALTECVMSMADEHAGGRLISLLEGGYQLSGLAAAVGAHVHTLATRFLG